MSTALILFGVKARPAACLADEEDLRAVPSSRRFRPASFPAGFRVIFTNPKLRTLVGLAWLCGVYIVPGRGRRALRRPRSPAVRPRSVC